MDKHNLFFTRTTYNFVRLDYLVSLMVLVGLIIVHWTQVNWLHFTMAFLWSDVVGTFPGLYWYYARNSGERRRIPTIFYVLYNTGHSFAAIAVVAGIWYLVTRKWEWAMLAMPIHLLGDRSIFGNIYKSLGLAFEPVPHKGFARFLEEFERGEGGNA